MASPSSTPTPHRPAIDVSSAVRGASAGFSILLIGGLLAPLVATLNTVVGSAMLLATSVVAFFVASRRIGVAGQPLLHGAVAAVLSYALVLPLVLRVPEGRSVPQIAFTLATAITVGALTGWLASQQPAKPPRARRSPRKPRS